MQQEGDEKLISLRGIERAKKGTISEDGAMNEVIGMIARNGSLVPYSPTDKGLNKANDIKMIRIHHTSTGDNVIVVRKQNNLTGEGGLYKIQYTDGHTYNDNGFCSHTITTIQRTQTTTTQSTVLSTCCSSRQTRSIRNSMWTRTARRPTEVSILSGRYISTGQTQAQQAPSPRTKHKITNTQSKKNILKFTYISASPNLLTNSLRTP